jgi:hypothetical protein
MDIRAGVPESYLATGFFTPDYQPLAERFSANLSTYGVPHHLYAIEPKDWHGATLTKPACVAWARRDYPAATIVSMDVDCRVRGSIAAASAIAADVGINFSGRIRERRPLLFPSTRVTVWRSTDNAKKLLDKWSSFCGASKVRNDEILLMQAILDTPGVAIETLAWPYRGNESSDSSEHAVIVHESAHAKVMPKQQLKRALRAMRHRLFEQITGTSYEDWKYGSRP